MAKAPRNSPTEAGQRVLLRANRERRGLITEFTPRQWCVMKWDDGLKLGVPKMCHAYELELLPIDGE